MPRFYNKNTIPVTPHQDSEAALDGLSPKIGESGEIQTLHTWTAPARPYRKKDRSYYTTLAIIIILLILIAFLAREFMLIGVLLALTFIAYVLAFVPPEDMDYKLTTQGVTIGDRFYFWHNLDSFWVKQKETSKVLFIQTNLRYPAQLMLVLKDGEEELVKKIAVRFLPFHEIPHTTLFDKWAESLQKHFPLENTHK